MKIIVNNIRLSISLVFKHSCGSALLYLFLALYSALFAPLQVYSIEKIVDALSLLMQNDLDQNLKKVLAFWSFILIISIIMSSLYDSFRPYLSLHMYKRLMISLTPDILLTINNINYCDFENSDKADIIHRVTRAPYALVQNQFNAFVNGIFFVTSTIGVVIMFCRISVVLGVLSIMCGLFTALIQYQVEKKRFVFEDKQNFNNRFINYISHLFVNKNFQYEIRVFNSENYFIKKLNTQFNIILNKYRDFFYKNIWLYLIEIFVLVFFIVISIIVIIMDLKNSSISNGEVFSFFTNLQKFFSLLSLSTITLQNIAQKSYNMNFYRKFLDLGAIPHKKNNIIENYKDNDEFDIVFDNVTFKYPNSDILVLDKVSFRIQKNTSVAIVGENGAGKSTLLKLICGLYIPTEGDIYIRGNNTKDLSIKDIGKYISVMFQDYPHYQFTIRENLALGNENDLNNDNKLLNALQIAHSDVLCKFDLNQSLGCFNNGVDLSEGEWQKITLARTSLYNKKIILFDEPTSAIDPVSESEMYMSLKKIIENKSALIVTHRLITAKFSKKILLLEGGKLIEQGTHKELMNKETKYRKMFIAQSKWYI